MKFKHDTACWYFMLKETLHWAYKYLCFTIFLNTELTSSLSKRRFGINQKGKLCIFPVLNCSLYIYSTHLCSLLYVRFSKLNVTRANYPAIVKVGHPQFKSATPQYCGQPNRLRSCGLKKVAELRLRTFKIWLPQLSTVFCQFRYVLLPFPQLRMALKINRNYF